MAKKPTPPNKKRTKPSRENSARMVYAKLNPNQSAPRIRKRNK